MKIQYKAVLSDNGKVFAEIIFDTYLAAISDVEAWVQGLVPEDGPVKYSLEIMLVDGGHEDE